MKNDKVRETVYIILSCSSLLSSHFFLNHQTFASVLESQVHKSSYVILIFGKHLFSKLTVTESNIGIVDVVLCRNMKIFCPVCVCYDFRMHCTCIVVWCDGRKEVWPVS